MLPLPAPPVLDDDDLVVVHQARDQVGHLLDDLRPHLLDHAGDSPTVQKSDGSPITDADLESDRRIHRDLSAAFPDHEVITEESATVWEGSRWTWIADPIDGTSNYAAGVPYWCVSIALCLDGIAVLGVVDAPPLGRRYLAVAGRGATVQRDGQEYLLHVRSQVDFRSGRSSHVPVGISAGVIRRSKGRVRLNPRILGAHALDYAMVAAGALAATWQRQPKVWDAAAGGLLVTEAGGAVLTSADGFVPLPKGLDLTKRPCEVMAGPSTDWLADLRTELSR